MCLDLLLRELHDRRMLRRKVHLRVVADSSNRAKVVGSAKASIERRILDYLRSRPGEWIPQAEIPKAIKANAQLTYQALERLADRGREVRGRGEGVKGDPRLYQAIRLIHRSPEKSRWLMKVVAWEPEEVAA